MQIIQFQIRDQVITWSCPGRDTIAGSEGLVKARFDFDAEWDDLSVTLFFSHDMVMDAVSVVYTGKDVNVPPSLLKDGFLRVSAIGLAADGDENLRVTTKYMARGIRVFRNGPVDGLPETEANPTLWEQALALIGPVSKLDTKDKSNLVAAINEVNKKQGGGIDQDTIDAAIEAALTEAKESGEFDGPKGDPFTYEDFTPEQLEALRGPKGNPGYTPQKGTDYFTAADKQELVADVLAALPRAEEADF